MAGHSFEKVYTCDLPDYDARGTLYRHPCGMEVFYVDADDRESFFSYSVKTLPEDSTGVFHILEHTVLSGSRKYPVRDPFTVLDAHSCNSYMNALTAPGRTIYPAASPVKKDFENIFSLYTDSIFAPLLERSDFASEGIRVTSEGFDGVVFNEMRGDACQRDSIVSARSKRDLFEASPFQYSSGGDVKQMVDLTYGKYLEVWKRFYNPANIRLFLYGKDIGLDEKLSMIEREYLSSIPFAQATASPSPTVRWHEPRREKAAFQANGSDDRCTVMLSFLTKAMSWDRRDSLFVSILVDALLGGPANPLYSALLESRLGSDLSQESGMATEFNEIPFSVGLDGVEESRLEEAEAFILSTLGRIADEGIGKDIVEASIRRQEFLVQEVGSGIPNGLRMMMKCIRGWERGLDLGTVLDSTSALCSIRRDLEANPRLFEDWMKDNLIDNPHRLTIFFTPSSDLVDRENAFLHEKWLEKKDSAEALMESERPSGLDLPMLSLDDISEEEDFPQIQDMGDGILFEPENTCGITYINQVTDLSDLDVHELVHAIMLSRYILIAGLEDEDPSFFHNSLRLESGGYYAYLETGRASDGTVKAFFVIRIKCLTRQSGKCLSLLHSWLERLDTSDHRSIEDALNDLIGDYESYVEESGSSFASSLSSASLTPSCSLGESLMGLECWKTVFSLSIDEVASGLERMKKRLCDRSRHIMLVTAQERDREDMTALARAFESRFCQSTCAPEPLVRSIGEKEKRIWYQIPSSVAYNAISFPSSPFQSREQEAESVYTQILTSTSLWNILRGQGGAYGAEAVLDSLEETVTLSSYRDPHVGKSFEAMERAMEETVVDSGSVDTAKMIRLGRHLKPLSPSQKSTLALRRYMYSITDDMIRKSRAEMRDISTDEVEKAKRRLIAMLPEASFGTIAPRSIFMKEECKGFDRRTLPSDGV